MKLVFATGNAHKLEEMQAALGNQVELVSLSQIGFTQDIPEPHDSLEENAGEKSGTVQKLTGLNCFAEDTGLEVDALGGEPGVRSARYAGESKSFSANIDRLLKNLEGKPDRSARFRTVISLRLDDREYLFEGICEGKIITNLRGDAGFGYDPVFIPDGGEKTFAEMSMEEKNRFSHRRKAADRLVDFLLSMTNSTPKAS